MDNYRPVSILSYFSNTSERIVYNRPYSFFFNNNILYEKQFGFSETTFVNEILKSFENNCYLLVVFIDLTKVDHNINDRS